MSRGGVRPRNRNDTTAMKGACEPRARGTRMPCRCTKKQVVLSVDCVHRCLKGNQPCQASEAEGGRSHIWSDGRDIRHPALEHQTSRGNSCPDLVMRHVKASDQDTCVGVSADGEHRGMSTFNGRKSCFSERCIMQNIPNPVSADPV